MLGAALLLLVAGLLVRDLTGGQAPALVLNDPESSNRNVVVHVAGAVAAPGVYELPPGARVFDAIQVAGGDLPGADTNELNLARRLRDGEKVTVPGPRSDVAAARGPDGRLDLNAATPEELTSLPGIGEAYSRRIVDSRIVDGPYESVEDLLTRRVIPEATLEGIRELVTVIAP